MRLALLGLLLPAALHAQPAPDSLLAAMAGRWHGEAVVQTPNGPLRLFQTEDVRRAGGAYGLLIHGTGYPLANGVPSGTAVFDAAGLLFPTPQGYRIRTLTHEGRSVEAHVAFVPGGLDWSFDTPGGAVRYEIRIADGRWHERGWFVPAGTAEARPTVEMTLQKLAP